MADVKAGVKAAVEALDTADLARRSADRRAETGTQGDLFGAAGGGELLDQAEAERLDGQLPLGQSEPARRGPGRPKGARNRRTTEVADYLVRRYGDPLEGLVSIGLRSTSDLIHELRRVSALHAMRLGGSVLDVLALQRQCLEAALPYIHARRAPTDEQGNVAVPLINVGMFAATPPAQQGDGNGLSIEDVPYTVRREENQSLSASATGASDDEASDDEG